jgi:hypothetical protein
VGARFGRTGLTGSAAHTCRGGRDRGGHGPADSITPRALCRLAVLSCQGMDEEAARLFWLGHDAGPGYWGHAIVTQWRRVLDAGRDREQASSKDQRDYIAAYHRLVFDSHFLVVAIRQLLHMQESILEQTGDANLKVARTKFDQAVPQVSDFRNFLEHLNEYLLNCGWLQKDGRVGQDPSLDVVYLDSDDYVFMRFDEFHLELHTATDAALELGTASAKALHNRIIEATRGGYGII